jgi:hypothetical protein
MSSMLEQAIIDAETLRDVALKNAEAAVIDKYSDQIKEAVETLLEQPGEDPVDELLGDMGPEDPLADDPLSGNDPVVDNMPLSAHDGESLCGCPDEAEAGGEESYIELDLDDLAQKIGLALGDEEELESHEQVASDVFNSGGPLEEDIELDSDILEELAEELKVDIHPQKSGWAGTPASHIELAAEEVLALEQDTKVKEEKEELRKAVKNLEESNKKLNKNIEKNKKQITVHKQNEKKLVQLLKSLKEKVEDSNVLNARLLYTNKALTNNSLNERQKNNIAEALFNAESVEEAKTIFETLQNTVGSTSKKQPKSLSEAVNKTSSTILLAAKTKGRETENNDTSSDRWRTLAGIK